MESGPNGKLLQLVPAGSAARVAERCFRRERVRIRRRLPAAIIQHIGATAIRGMPTKGDLDIVVRVDPSGFADAEQALARLYFRNYGSTRSPAFASFKDDRSSPPLGVQLVAIGSEHDDFDLLRDQFRVSASSRRAIARLKKRFHNRSMRRYRDAKSALIATLAAKEPLASLLAARRSGANNPKH